jgi:hypothetical protein
LPMPMTPTLVVLFSLMIESVLNEIEEPLSKRKEKTQNELLFIHIDFIFVQHYYLCIR